MPDQNAEHVAATAAELIARKQAGGDCTEDESAWIKGYFDAFDPLKTQPGADLANAYPLECDEWAEEAINGMRPNDSGKDIIAAVAHRLRDTFTTPFDQYANREGQRFNVLAKITEPDEDHDAEVLPMYRIRFDDGFEIDAWPEEVER